MKLVIVESPTKAKTIGKFLGKGYKVLSSFGHIRDLPSSKMGVDIENNFEPKYLIPPKARPKVKELKEVAKKATEVILASDEDREGEAIAWHLTQALDLDPNKTKRIVFHEITKKAIEKALDSPRTLDMHLVDAQQARRILDRLVGYELSPLLWKKIRRGLSAGRVQSVALRCIVEREKERERFQTEKFWKIDANLASQDDANTVFTANLTERNGKKIESKQKLPLFAGDYTYATTSLQDPKEVVTIVKDLEGANYTINNIESKESQRSPVPPFITSTLQQSAINSLSMSSKQTMMLAQKLYENGLITYMRTDSTNLAMDALLEAKKVITEKFGKKYALDTPRFFKKKSKGAQEAHEAIRPTSLSTAPEDVEAKLDRNHARLYRLIWNRTIACQMAPALIESTKVTIEAKNKETYTFLARGSRIIFDGYLAVYGTGLSEENELPKLEKEQKLNAKEILPLEKETTPPPRYTEASLVKTLEEQGIGRPATYAAIISTLFDRQYIERDESKRLFPQEIGTLVSDLLSEHFTKIVDLGFTATLEDAFDEIATGEKDWQPVVGDVYNPFHKLLEKKQDEIKKEDVLEKVGKDCPDCGKELIYRFGRFGKFISCSGYPDCKYVEKTEQDKAEEAQFADEKCDKCGAPMQLKRSRFGSFLGCSKYPECKNIKRIEKHTGVKCPDCGEGDIVERKSKRGKIFYGCHRYPKCEFALWSKPTGEKCKVCNSLMIFTTKGETQCSNKSCGK